MHVMYFTERGRCPPIPPISGWRAGHTALMFSNKHFDPVAGSELYNRYLEHYIYAEEQGVEGFMLNEHHNAPFCMQAKCNVFASILAAVTKKAKIVLLGNPLPLAENPVRLAEELAMIDMISKGRLVSGFVRGGGQEQLATGVNPAFNRERFEEAHDLVTAAWSRQGPFRWEGAHYQHRVVNPWAVPLQKPYPRVWIPGVLSKETIIWAAKQRYPYIALNTSIEATKGIWKIYDETAREVGYESGPENRGYLQQIHVSDSEEKAERNARQFLWMQGEVHRSLAHPVWANPSGYFSPTLRRNFVEFAVGRAEDPRGRARPSSSRSLTAACSLARRRRSFPRSAACSKRRGPRFTASGAMTARSATPMRAPASGCWGKRSCQRCARSARNWASRIRSSLTRRFISSIRTDLEVDAAGGGVAQR